MMMNTEHLSMVPHIPWVNMSELALSNPLVHTSMVGLTGKLLKYKIHTNGTYDIDFNDGDQSKAVLSRDI